CSDQRAPRPAGKPHRPLPRPGRWFREHAPRARGHAARTLTISTSMTRYYRGALAALALISLAACGENPEMTEAQAKQQAEQQVSGKALTSVQVVPAERRQMQAWVYSQGTARSRQREFLTFTQQGLVTHVDAELRVGMPVKAGQLIANQAPERVTADLQAAKAALAEAQASLE